MQFVFLWGLFYDIVMYMLEYAMKRHADEYFREWKRTKNRKPLIVRGARQVGKTYAIEAFGREYSSFIKIDFEETPSLKSLFQGDLDVSRITAEICALTGNSYDPAHTLLFLDEIQECPEAIKALRYFHEKMPELSVITAGSLLEFSITPFSFPVGRVSFYWMYPMTFKEYLFARGAKTLAGYIPDKHSRKAVPDSIHKKLLGFLKEYFITGGMPEAIKTFIETSSYQSVAEIQNDIIYSYIEDIAKHYSLTNKELISSLVFSCAKQIGSQIKYTRLIPGERSDTIKAVLKKLYKVLIVHPVYAANGEHPFKASTDHKIFKQIFLDIGLMQNICGIQYEKLFLESELMASYHGALAEQFVGQELIAYQNHTPPALFYWTRQKQGGQAEIDFLLEDQPIIPVEVKSDKAGRLRSMHQSLKQFSQSPFGIVLSTRNVELLEEQKLLFLPLYSDLTPHVKYALGDPR